MPWRKIIFHREELYAEIWDKPVLTVAKRYGISSVGLAKISSGSRFRFHHEATGPK